MSTVQQSLNDLANIADQIHGRCQRLKETGSVDAITIPEIENLRLRLAAIYSDLPEAGRFEDERRNR